MATLSLNIDARGATTGAKQFQIATNNIKTSATQAATSTHNAGSALQRMANMSGAQRFVFQNTANQLGDIAVQASMGTNMFRVLGMQLPQVAGGFAILAIVFGNSFSNSANLFLAAPRVFIVSPPTPLVVFIPGPLAN